MSSPRGPKRNDPSSEISQPARGGALAPGHGAATVAADLLSIAMDQATESIFIADTAGRIVYANLAASRRAGRPREQLIDRHFSVALAAGQDPARYEEISRKVSEGEAWSGAVLDTSSDNPMMAVDLVVSPVRDEGGRIAAVVAIGRDVDRGSSLKS